MVFSFEDSVSAIMESVAVMLADELEDQGNASRIANPLMGILLDFFLSRSFFPFDPLTLEENDNSHVNVSNIYPLSFLVPSYLRTLHRRSEC